MSNGLPQGSVLAPALFNIYIADIPATQADKFMYADDIAILHQSPTFSALEDALNADLSILENYFSQWHLKPSPSKTVSSVFHLNNSQAQRPLALTFCGRPLQHSSQPKYLGVILDRSLTYKPHIEMTKNKLKSQNNIFSRLTGTRWGSNADVLRTSTLALCYSVAEYCAPVWERSAHTHQIDTQLNRAMRTITGTVSSTPNPWLPVLSNIAPPNIRRAQASRREYNKAICSPQIPLHHLLSSTPNPRLRSRHPFWTMGQALSGPSPLPSTEDLWREQWAQAPPRLILVSSLLVLA